MREKGRTKKGKHKCMFYFACLFGILFQQFLEHESIKYKKLLVCL